VKHRSSLLLLLLFLQKIQADGFIGKVVNKQHFQCEIFSE